MIAVTRVCYPETTILDKPVLVKTDEEVQFGVQSGVCLAEKKVLLVLRKVRQEMREELRDMRLLGEKELKDAHLPVLKSRSDCLLNLKLLLLKVKRDKLEQGISDADRVLILMSKYRKPDIVC